MTWKPAQIAAISVVDGVVVVDHGGDANVVRPPAKVVHWRGTVAPNGGGQGDIYYKLDSTGNTLEVLILQEGTDNLKITTEQDVQNIIESSNLVQSSDVTSIVLVEESDWPPSQEEEGVLYIKVEDS
jgi:hypothetical protein